MVMRVTAQKCVAPHMVAMMKPVMAMVMCVIMVTMAVMASRVRRYGGHGGHSKDQGEARDNRFPTPEKLAHVLFRHSTRP
jgi:hypothetical protein